MSLRERIEALATPERESYGGPDRALFAEFRAALARGEIRAAERMPDGAWCVNAWVKRGILLGFRMGALTDMSAHPTLRFFDKDTYPVRPTTLADRVRVVPGGSSIRDGAYVAPGVVWLEPVGALPVIIEDDVLVGGGCGVYEGTIVRQRAVLAAGTILTGSTPVYDLVRERVYRRSGDGPLEIPAGAVVAPGARAVQGAAAARWGISLYTPVIVKYRDEKTDAATLLEEYLR